MAKNTVDLIRNAESEATSIENEAKILADEKIVNAKAKATEIIKNRTEKANSESSEKIRLAEDKALEMINQSKELSKSDSDKLIADALLKQQEVDKEVLNIII